MRQLIGPFGVDIYGEARPCGMLGAVENPPCAGHRYARAQCGVTEGSFKRRSQGRILLKIFPKPREVASKSFAPRTG